MEQVRLNRFDSIAYRNSKTKSRIVFAKAKIKQYNIEHIYINKKLFIKPDYGTVVDMYYSPELRVYIRRTLVGDTYKNITMGEKHEDGCIREMTYKTLLLSLIHI